MALDIKIENIKRISTSTKVEVDDDGQHLVTKVTFEAEISPNDLARVHNLARQPVAINANISTDQKAFDCLLVDRQTGVIQEATDVARKADF